MNNQDYEQKKRECWEEFCRANPSHNKSIFARKVFDFAFDRAYALGKQETDAEDDKTLKVNRQLFCRLCADADDYINEHLEEEDNDYGYYQGRSDALHELYRGECKDAEDTVLGGWVARDEDGRIYLYEDEPKRENGKPYGKSSEWVSENIMTKLSVASFPDLTWDSDPLEVEITIKRKKNG